MYGFAMRPAEGSLVVRKVRGAWQFCSDEVAGWEYYDPISTHRDLFVEFANLGRNGPALARDERIQAFAQTFGFLSTTLHHDDDGNLLERISDWRQEIRNVSQTIDLWMKLDSPSGKLSKHIHRDKSDILYEDCQGGYFAIAQKNDRHFRYLKDMKPSEIGLFALTKMVNAGLEGRTHTFVSSESLRTRELSFHVKAQGIAAAVWVQVARAVSRKDIPRPCEQCERLISPRRNTKQFCDSNCRVRHHREGKAKTKT